MATFFRAAEAALLGMVLVGAALVMLATELLAPIDRLLYGSMLRLWGREPAADIVLVAIDEPSLEQLGRWPWPREVHARLVERLSAAGVGAVAFHILFSEPDPAGVEGDARFARAIAASGRVALAVAPSLASAGGPMRAVTPLPALAANARLGHVDVELDADGVARSVFLKAGLQRPQWAFLGLAALQIAEPEALRFLPGERNQRPPQGDTVARWSRDYRILIPFASPPGGYRSVSYAAVLADPRVAEGLRGKIVLVGVTAAGLDTPLPTPVGGWSGTMSTLEYSANVIDAVQGGTAIRPLSGSASMVFTVLFAVLAAFSFPTVGRRRTLLLTAFLLGAILLGSFTLLRWQHLWFPATTAMAIVLFAQAFWTWRRLQTTARALRKEKESTVATLHSIADAVITTDAGGHINYMNPVAESLTGYRLEEAQGRNAAALLQIRDEAGMAVPLQLASSVPNGDPGGFTRHGFLLDRAGVSHAIRAAATRIGGVNDRPEGMVVAISDVSETLALSQRMRHQATHDSLTGLPNRALLEDRLQQAVAHAQREGRWVAVLFVDIDRFKHVIESLGHSAGDDLLRQWAERLRAHSRESDTVARWSGDTFAIVIESLPARETAGVIAEKLLVALKGPLRLAGQDTHVSASIGISLFPDDGRGVAELLKQAGMAMHRAKELGAGHVQFYSADMDAWVQQRHDLERGLRLAVQREELRLHYQPQVELATGRITGAEALLRWQRADGRLLPPGDFIAVAEETGLIHEIGQWVLERTCQQAKAWQADGLPALTLSVNLSPRQFSHHDLLGQVTRTVASVGLDPTRLKLEITENAFVREQEQAIAVLRELRALGLGVSLDDFGTGYSSLSYIKHFPVGEIKLDKSFVTNVTHDLSDAAIARAVVALGHGMRLGVVAEGVEHPAQLHFLRELGCDTVQGFLMSRPVGADEFAALLRSGGGHLPLPPA